MPTPKTATSYALTAFWTALTYRDCQTNKVRFVRIELTLMSTFANLSPYSLTYYNIYVNSPNFLW